MSLYKDASLVMIPSAYKDGKLYSIRPTDGSGDFTFSRGSNLAATRVDVNGLIEKGRENLFLHSNNFSDAEWDVKSGTFSQGVSDPNGGSNAWSWTSVNTAPYLYQRLTPYSGISCLSIWVKGVGSTIGANFQIRGGSGNPIKTITLTSDWQRVQHYGDYSSQPFVGFEFGIPAVTGDVVHIYQAQYEQGLVATDYIETGASTAQAGILEDMPRLDYSGGASCPALLLEPQRTNKITNSEYINTTTFNQTNLISISNNYAASPEGLQNAAKIIPTAVSGYHQIRTDLATPNGYDIISCFVKASGYNYVQLASWADPANYVNFDLTDGSIGSVGLNGPSIKDIEDFGNGWYRIYANVKASGGGLIGIGIVTSASAGWSQSFTGNGTDGILVWGVQIEAGSYPTSYIPTYGSSVTRSQDAMYKTGVSDLIGSSLGTIFIHTTFDSTPTYTQRVYKIDDGTSNNMIGFSRYGADNLNVYFQSNGTSSVAIVKSGTIPKGTEAKVAISYEEDRVKVFLNGVEIASDTSAAMPVGLSRILFSNDTSGNLLSDQHISQFATFPTALTDSECIALTTI